MNRITVNCELSKEKKLGLAHPLMFLATFILCVVALNADWSSMRFLWWSCIAFFALSWFFTSEMRLVIDVNYTIWLLGFFAFCVLSICWAHSFSSATTALKSLLVHMLVLIFLRSSILEESDINRLLAIIAGASIVNATYLMVTNFEMLTSNVDAEIGTRLGSEGTWNANAVGMMAAVATLILLYNTKKTKNVFATSLYLIVIAGMVFVSFLSGSRTALAIVLLGTVVYLLLTSQKKRFRTILFIVVFVLAVYYAILKIPFFYSVIGWRVEGFMAMFTGEGTVDSSAEYRKVLIGAAIDTWKQYPIVGCGLDCFRLFGMIATGKDYYAHNNYVELLADLGVLGTMIYYSGYLFVMSCLLLRLKNSNNLEKLLFTLLGIVIVIDYACVSYNDFLFKLLFLAMFASISVNKKGEDKFNA